MTSAAASASGFRPTNSSSRPGPGRDAGVTSLYERIKGSEANAVRDLAQLCRDPSTSAAVRADAARAAVDHCETARKAGRLHEVPSFLKCLAAQALDIAPGPGFDELRAYLGALPKMDPQLALSAATKADGSPLLSAKPLKLVIDSHGEGRWQGAKPTDLMAGKAQGAAPVDSVGAKQERIAELLLVIRRNEKGELHCKVVNGDRIVSKEHQASIEKALRKSGISEVRWQDVSDMVKNRVSDMPPEVLYSSLMRSLPHHDEPSWDDIVTAIDHWDRSLDGLAREDVHRLDELLRCETAWLHAAWIDAQRKAEADRRATERAPATWRRV